jgi:Aldo/keto reductase family
MVAKRSDVLCPVIARHAAPPPAESVRRENRHGTALSRPDLRSVSRLGLGAMMFGPWGNNDRKECVRIVHRDPYVGINVIDTADVYPQGQSEETVGDALAAVDARTSSWPPSSTTDGR